MTYISDAIWAQVIEAERRLPAEARIEFEEAIRSHLEGERAKSSRVTPERRDALRAVKRSAESARHRLTYQLLRYHSTAGNEATLPDADLFGGIDAVIHTADESLSQRTPKNWRRKELRWRLGPLITELLEIKSFYLKVDVPTQAGETANSGYFHKFLEVFLRLVEPHATRAERKNMLKVGIDFAVEVNQYRKAQPIYSWQWDELFPQSYRSLMKSRRFSAG